MDGVHGVSSHVWTDVILEKWHWCLPPFSLFPDGCLYWAFEKCRVIFSVYCATLCEEIHVQYTFRVPEDGGHNLPSGERGFRFFGFRRSWVTPLHWRTFALGREVMHPRLVRCHDRIKEKAPFLLVPRQQWLRHLQPCTLVFVRQEMKDPSVAQFRVLKVLFDDCFHTTITDVQYSRQLADSYSPVLPNECIDAVSGHAFYGSPQPALMRFILYRFPSFFFPLIDTNIWQCPLTILHLQSWTDFRGITTFFRQEFDYNALLHANEHLHFAHLPHNWKNCAVAKTRSVIDLGTVLPPSTYYYFQRTVLHFLTTNK